MLIEKGLLAGNGMEFMAKLIHLPCPKPPNSGCWTACARHNRAMEFVGLAKMEGLSAVRNADNAPASHLLTSLRGCGRRELGNWPRKGGG